MFSYELRIYGSSGGVLLDIVLGGRSGSTGLEIISVTVVLWFVVYIYSHGLLRGVGVYRLNAASGYTTTASCTEDVRRRRLWIRVPFSRTSNDAT